MKNGDCSPLGLKVTMHSAGKGFFKNRPSLDAMNLNLASSALYRVLVCILLTGVSAYAFFPEPDPLTLDTGTSGVVKVKGDSGGAKVSLQSISIAPSNGGVTHDLVGVRNGTGSVNVNLTGVQAGNYVVTFSGKNNAFDVQGSITVIVRSPPATSAQNPFYAFAGDPINTRSGEYYGVESVDLALGGPMPLNFIRYVASNLEDDDLVEASLGSNRSHNFASRIIFESATVKRVILPEGRMLRFDKTGKNWVLKLPHDVPFQLVESGTDFLLGHPHSKQIWTYDSAGRLRSIADGKGNVHTLDYTAGKLSSISDGLGRVIEVNQPGSLIEGVTAVTGAETREITFAYTGGVLTSATDFGGHTTTYSNTESRPTSFTRPEGNTPFTQLYTAAQVTSQTERGTDTSTLDYQAGSTTFTDPTGETMVDHYDGSGNLISHVDEAGQAITMTYDSSGRRDSVTDRLGHKVTLAYHSPTGLPAVITNAEGRKAVFSYKARSLNGLVFYDLVKITWPDGASRSWAYDARGNITQIKDETGKTWKRSFNDQGQVLTDTNPLGGVSVYSYDAHGNLANVQPPDEGLTQFAYDQRHRLATITHPGGAVIQYDYDNKDRLESITDERGKVYELGYDDNNRLTGIQDPDLMESEITYDDLDRVASIVDRLNQTSSMTFNSRRLLASFTNPNGHTMNFNYDERQRLIGFEDAGGQTWIFDYDQEGRLTSLATPITSAEKIKRNALGYIMETSNPLGHTTRLVRDAMQRVIQSFDPMGRQTVFNYDKRGRLIGTSEQNTGSAKYARDALGHLTKITAPNGGSWSAAYLKSGRVAKLTDPLGRNTGLTYDSRGRLASLSIPDSTTCSLTYDEADHLTNATFSDGLTLAYTHDDLGRLASADGVTFDYDAEDRLTGCEQNGKAFTATYDNGGRLKTVSYHDGALIVTYGYDSRDRLIEVTDSLGTDLDLSYDDAGRLTGITRASGGVSTTYTYDEAGRLTRIQEGGFMDLQYALNAAGEVTSVDFTAPSVPSVTSEVQALKFGKAGEITSPEFVYDTRGRLMAAPMGQSYEWDGASRLVEASGVTMTYNGMGDLATRVESGETTRFYHHYALSLTPIVYEDPDTGNDRAYVWTPSGRLLYSVDLGTHEPSFYHFDHLGSTLALSDDSGAVTDSYAYGPYGEPLARTGNSSQPFTYIGAYGVRQEGILYQMRARYYDPGTAQFISRDPLPPRLDDLKSLNPYSYASQNPMRYIDPEGEELQISGAGRIGLAYPDRPYSSTPSDLTTRMRLRFDMSTETDSGVRLAPRMRLHLNSEAQSSVDWGVLAGFFGGGHSNAGYFSNPYRKYGLDDGSVDLYSYAIGGITNGLNLYGDYRTLSNGGSQEGGGIFNGGSTINISDSVIADNSAPRQAENAAGVIILQTFINIYNALKNAEDALLIEMQRTFSSDEAKVKAYEDLKRHRKAIGKIIKKMGGSLPR